MDIFGAGSFSQAPKEVSLQVHEDPQLKVEFKLSRDQANKSLHKITAVYSNKSTGLITDLNMLVSVKKYLTLNLFSVSNSTMAPGALNGSTQ